MVFSCMTIHPSRLFPPGLPGQPRSLSPCDASHKQMPCGLSVPSPVAGQPCSFACVKQRCLEYPHAVASVSKGRQTSTGLSTIPYRFSGDGKEGHVGKKDRIQTLPRLAGLEPSVKPVMQ